VAKLKRTRDVCKTLMPPCTFIIGCTSLYYEHEWKLHIIGIFEVQVVQLCQNSLIIPKTKLDLYILMINLYTKYHFIMCNQCKENERKLQIIGIFLSPIKSYNSVKNESIVPKTEPDLDIFMINLYTKYHFNTCNQCKENERKLQIIGIFLSPIKSQYNSVN
jgi:hypothetical protein